METEAIVAAWSGGSAVVAAAVGAAIAAFASRSAEKRTDNRATDAEKRRSHERQQTLLEDAADAFRDELVILRSMDGTVPMEHFYAGWWERREVSLRQKIDRLLDDELRSRLLLVVDCVADHLVYEFSWETEEVYLTRLYSLGRELAMAAYRGQPPSTSTLENMAEFEKLRRMAEDSRAREAERRKSEMRDGSSDE